ncbi:F-box protein pp2-b15 [Phtheirospermum japonicum]|uniref:F-box protein pp2-b15 n=1 Tax=Phtheirospermum japonicum TaxID=374723 RepID=A0A830B3U9_9LAMI|nr:F-box protein pp2-b15 [Phtheirospermum japonicum]
MADTRVEELPEECLSHVISFTSPQDACRSAIVSSAFRDAADADGIWENFLPPDYRDIISRSVSPVEFSSKKDLFRRLSSTPLLIDGGKMVVELRMVCWLEIYGKINITKLSPHTTYGAYLIIQLTERAFGLDVVPSEASIQIESYKSRGMIYLNCNERKRHGVDTLKEGEHNDRVVCVREDKWLEVELGEFYNTGNLKEVKMWFREIKGVHLKGGLLVEGIELRPKH